MTNYDGGYDDGNKDRNKDDNAASGSESDGLIFNLIMTPRSRGGGSGDDGNGAMAAAHYISTLLKMCHKLLYAKFGVFNCCHCHIEKKSQFN